MNPFGTEAMASGYARSRPPVHEVVMERLAPHLRGTPRRALDVGCGAGISTRALAQIAEECIGLEPSEAMLRWTRDVAPDAGFVVGAAERMPFARSSIDLLTAAGSLNYVDLPAFFPEAIRLLRPDGMLAVYDFSADRSFRDSADLDSWFDKFQMRYPPPPREARTLNPGILSQLDSGFLLQGHEYFEVALTLTSDFYRDYMLTETNAAAAVRAGVPLSEIRSWCEETLGPVWNGRSREVLFRGYFACMVAARQ